LCALCTAICCENLRGLRKILRILKLSDIPPAKAPRR
jgi:hypothetical protein